jgi:hypothetical protein
MIKRQTRLIILFIILFLVSSLYGQKLKSIGLNSGYIAPLEDVKNGFSLEARADFGEVLKYIFLFPSVGYKNVVETLNEQDFTRTHINFGAYFVGYINSKPQGFYGGLGIHYHVIQTEKLKQDYLNDEPSIIDETNTKLGLSVNLGYLLKFKKVSIYLEPGYNYIQGGFSILEVRLGISYILKK